MTHYLRINTYSPEDQTQEWDLHQGGVEHHEVDIDVHVVEEHVFGEHELHHPQPIIELDHGNLEQQASRILSPDIPQPSKRRILPFFSFYLNVGIRIHCRVICGTPILHDRLIEDHGPVLFFVCLSV